MSEFQLKYFAPAEYDDELIIECNITKFRGARLGFGYRIKKNSSLIVVEGETLHGCTDLDNNVFEGKFRRGKFVNKIDKKTREITQLDVNTGASFSFEIKGTGKISNEWFEAEKTSSGTYALTAKGAKDMKTANDKAEESGGGSGGSGGGC